MQLTAHPPLPPMSTAQGPTPPLSSPTTPPSFSTMFGAQEHLIGDELGGDVSSVNLHALLHLHCGLQAVAGLNGQHTICAHLIQSLSDHGPYQVIVSSRNCCYALHSTRQPQSQLYVPKQNTTGSLRPSAVENLPGNKSALLLCSQAVVNNNAPCSCIVLRMDWSQVWARSRPPR